MSMGGATETAPPIFDFARTFFATHLPGRTADFNSWAFCHETC
jgi:hypothetical protein